MKFRITMKDPDGFHESIGEAAEQMEIPEPYRGQEEAIRGIQRDALCAICTRWFEYNEYLTVEVDTEAGTCAVVPRGE